MKRQGILISIVLAIVFAMAVLKLSNLLSFFDLYLLLKVTFFFLLSVFLIYLVQKKHSFYLPSFYLFLFFCVVPIFGTISYHIYNKLFPDYLGVDLDMKHAVDLWFQGTFFIVLGIFSIHMLRRAFSEYGEHRLEAGTYTSWNWEYFHYILFLLAGISLVLTIATVCKIGYIPILKGDIEGERFNYSEKVGEWTYKLARLWILVYLFAFVKLLRNIRLDKGFYVHKNLFLILLMILSLVFEGMYGDRFRQFIMVAFSIIMVNKIVGKVRLRYLIVLIALGQISAQASVFLRSQRVRETDLPFYETAMFHTCSEFGSFAYAVQEFSERDYLHGKAFLGTLAPLLPKQVWRAFNINKEKLSKFSSASVMKEIFSAPAGIRIGIIGEGFINFGYLGIIIVPFLSGILFSILENIFLSLRCFDVKEIIVAFIISIMMYLPLAQTNALTSPIPLRMYFIIVCIILFYKKANYWPLELESERILAA